MIAFGYWSFYWHFRSVGTPEFSAITLAALPMLLVFLFINRERLSNVLSAIERLKVGDYLELEFHKAAQRIEQAVIPTVSVDEAVFSEKRGLTDLHHEVRKAIEKLTALSISKRVIYLQVDLRRETGSYFDASALYFYLLVLREAVGKVQGNLVGVLIHDPHTPRRRSWSLISTNDYIMEFERLFPEVRQQINMKEIQDALDRSNEPDVNYRHLFQRVQLEGDRSLIHFLPRLRSHRRRLRFIEEDEVPSLARQIPQLLRGRFEYVLVLREGELFAVIPVATVTAVVSDAVVGGIGEKEKKPKPATRR